MIQSYYGKISVWGLSMELRWATAAATLICLYFVNGCFPITESEQSDCDRDIWSFTENVCLPCDREIETVSLVNVTVQITSLVLESFTCYFLFFDY